MAKQDFKPTQMAESGRGRGRLCAVASAVVLAVLTAMTAAANAQGMGPQITAGAAQSVDLKTAPEVPSVRPPAGLVTSRPTIPIADYLAAKRAAALKARQPKPGPQR
jgi:hypothetical protein